MAQHFMQTSAMPVEGCAVAWVPVMVMPLGARSPGQPSPAAWPAWSPSPTPLQSGLATPRSEPSIEAPKWRPSASSTVAPGSDGDDVVSLSDVDEEVDDLEACRELLSQIRVGGALEREAAIDALVGSVAELSFDPVSCRIVQAAIEVADTDVAASLARELRGHIVDALQCPHANHVVQKIVDVLPVVHSTFVMKDLQGRASQMARHRFGCRVLTRLVERHAAGDSAEASCMAEELIREAAELSRHTHAHHVVEALLEHGTADQIAAITTALRKELLRNAKNRSATYVVEKLLQCNDSLEQAQLVEDLFGNIDALMELVNNQFGCHVAKAALRLPDLAVPRARVQAAAAQLQRSKFGRRLLAELNGGAGEDHTN